jgi:hypothetical protein
MTACRIALRPQISNVSATIRDGTSMTAKSMPDGKDFASVMIFLP